MRIQIMNTAVAFIIFKRPDTTRRVFETIRRAKPPRLYLIADGARPEKPGEVEAVAATREVVSKIDWPCEVTRIFSDKNLGCQQRVFSGLNEVFATEPEAIILEDDCLPDPSFFNFCEELLERYRDVPRVMQISGSNFQSGHKRSPDSYYFSMYPHSWGWATWRDAWKKLDLKLCTYSPQPIGQGWARYFTSEEELAFWTHILEPIHKGTETVSAWDYQWTYTCWRENGLCIHPAKNLVENIGFGADATHTEIIPHAQRAKRHALKITRHPIVIERNHEADDYTFQAVYQWHEMRWYVRAWSALRIFLGRIRRKLLPV